MCRAPSNGASRQATQWPVLAAVFALGVSCVTTQLALMREMLCAFAGNELVLGVVLGNWLLLMGLGTALGRITARLRNPRATLATLLIFTAVLPPAQIVALRLLRQVVFLRGAALGVLDTAATSFVILLPYCLVAGFILVLACEIVLQAGDGQGAGRVYAMDSLGSMVGGAGFSLLLVLWLDPITLLMVPGLLNLSAAAGLTAGLFPGRKLAATWRLATILVLTLAGVVLVMTLDLDALTTSLQFPGQRLLFRGQSPYGRLVVAESGGQTNFFENGVAMASTPSLERAEESAHLALAQRPHARRVLLVGGVLDGIPREILRYGVSRVDCVESDPMILRLGRQFLPQDLKDRRLHLFEGDARQFVRHATARYDLVVLALPDPTTAQLNRCFTREFFEELRRVLEPGGVVSLGVGQYVNYASPELVRVLSCTRRTLAASFRQVLVLPGSRVFFLASDGPLDAEMAGAIEQAGFRTRWVTRSWLAAMMSPDRLADVQRAAGGAAPENRDFAPVLYYLGLRHWVSQFEGGTRWLTTLLVILAGVFVLRLRGAACAVFASGFAASALEVILLLGTQILVGSLYRQMALVVTVFMAGLAVGALVATRWLERVEGVQGQTPRQALPADPPRGQLTGVRPALGWLALGIAGLGASLPLALPALRPLGGFAVHGLIATITFGLACAVGAQFPLANRLEATTRHPATRLYTADFVGAWGGALLTSTLLVPLVGVIGVCGITGGLNLLAGWMMFRKETAE